jgi:hypothetical protein
MTRFEMVTYLMSSTTFGTGHGEDGVQAKLAILGAERYPADFEHDLDVRALDDGFSAKVIDSFVREMGIGFAPAIVTSECLDREFDFQRTSHRRPFS